MALVIVASPVLPMLGFFGVVWEAGRLAVAGCALLIMLGACYIFARHAWASPRRFREGNSKSRNIGVVVIVLAAAGLFVIVVILIDVIGFALFWES